MDIKDRLDALRFGKGRWFFDRKGMFKLKKSSLANGYTSDGYHTFNELYAHRNELFVALMQENGCKDKAWFSKKHADGTMFEGMFIAGLNLPAGVITYHLENKYLRNFRFIKELDKAPEWDGHTSEDVIYRLGLFNNKPVD